MSLTDRDRKVVMFLVPLLVLVGYWFLILGPKREAASRAGDELAKQEQKRDAAVAKLGQSRAGKAQFASDYASLVRLGKAIPSSVDMPSLMVQLDQAARGTGIRFSRIAAGESDGGGTPSAGAAPAGGAPAGGAPPANGGGAPAQSQPGQSAEKAHNAAGQSDAANAKREQGGSGGTPASGGSTGKEGSPSPGADTPACAPGLQCVPLEFEFNGGFFDLADFFHRLKRFVHVANDRIQVQGRLLTIDNFKFASAQDSFPSLKAEVKATVYLAPKSEGTTAGATPAGPGSAPGAQQPASAPAAPAPPTATATP